MDDAHTQPRRLNLLPALDICHGYANGCTCKSCKTTADNIAKYGFTDEGKIAIPPPAQPWQVKPARHAA